MLQRMKERIHPSSLKLASLYLTIIVVISLFFSAVIYSQSMHELERGLRGPRGGIERSLGQSYSQSLRESIILERESMYDEARARVLSRLIVTNLLIIVAGGALSYYLAVRTLRPIEQAQAAQNRFTADASHELRTPITAMLAENEVALMDKNLTLKDAKDQISSNIEELQKLTELSDGLMRLAGLENSKLEKSTINMKTVVRSAVDSLQHKAEQQEITIVTKLPNKISNIMGDEHSIREVIIILLDNAIKYSSAKSTVTVELSSSDKYVHVSVSDSGIGIKASEIPYLFERFYRADTSRTKQGVSGYGLGLAIAHDIVAQHGGTISVKSELSAGSTFTIRLPLA